MRFRCALAATRLRTGTSSLTLAKYYAEEGDEAFRARLYEIVEQKPDADCPYLGEDEILHLDGEQAFLFAVRVRGERLATIEWDWDDAQLIDNMIERIGEERTVSLLISSTETGVKRFYNHWDKRKEKKLTKDGITAKQEQDLGDRQKSLRVITVSEIVEMAKSENQGYKLRSWGMCADEADLNKVFDILCNTDAPLVVSKLLRVFSNRELPKFDSRLIALCQHGDEDVQMRAFSALEQNSDPSIHSFALEQLKGEFNNKAVCLFINSYEKGDEEIILQAMTLPTDYDELHWQLMDVVKVLENNPQAVCSHLSIIAYSLTPCSICRAGAAKLLFKNNVAPKWLIEECRYDSEERCRELAEKYESN